MFSVFGKNEKNAPFFRPGAVYIFEQNWGKKQRPTVRRCCTKGQSELPVAKIGAQEKSVGVEKGDNEKRHIPFPFSFFFGEETFENPRP